jgi:hypothetical protein
MAEGKIHAERFQSGTMVGGLVTGALTGLLGTGIGALLLGPGKMDAMAYRSMEGKGDDYRTGFELTWNNGTRHKRRMGFLGGGALGTLAFLVIYAANASE